MYSTECSRLSLVGWVVGVVGVVVAVVVGGMEGGGFGNVAAEDTVVPVFYPAHDISMDTFITE